MAGKQSGILDMGMFICLKKSDDVLRTRYDGCSSVGWISLLKSLRFHGWINILHVLVLLKVSKKLSSEAVVAGYINCFRGISRVL